MELITWDQNYSVGVAEIDEQHKKIITIINQLYQLFSEKKMDADINPTFEELVSYADIHFSTEERYFELCNYEKRGSHIEMHNKYREEVQELKNKYENEKSEAIFFEVTNFLREWWVWHITKADQDYVDCFHKYGLK